MFLNPRPSGLCRLITQYLFTRSQWRLWGLFAIVLAAYDVPMTVPALSAELGVSTVYLEDELDILEAAGILKKSRPLSDQSRHHHRRLRKGIRQKYGVRL